MAIRLKCAHCGRAVAVTRRAAGTQVPCPVCRQPLEIPPVATVERAAKPQAAAPASINYRIVGSAAAAAVGVLAVLAVVATAANRRPSYRHWQSSEACGRLTPALKLAHLDRPLFDETVADEAVVPAFESQTAAAPPVDEMQYQPPPPLVVNRRDQLDDEDLRKQLLKVPELSLYRNARYTNKLKGQYGFRAINIHLRTSRLHEIIHTVGDRDDLAGLPMIAAPDCELGEEPSKQLQKVSTELRTKMFAASQQRGAGTLPGDTTEAIAEALRSQRRFAGNKKGEIDFSENAIPAFMQMLCVENRKVRHLMSEYLGDSESKTASRALAKMAVFDLSDKVRATAVKALAQRPRGEYRQVLLNGLRYPWAPAADHAAEALVALEDTDALPDLKELARLPDPSAPVYDRQQRKYFVREVVRINHLGNCMLCHAPSKSTTDLVRGRIATPGEALPPPVQYYAGQDGIFVRADITYLRQDFSVVQPVDDHGAWPSQQRFDYLVRNRPIDVEDVTHLRRLAPADYPQRDAVLHAISELSSMPAKQRANDEVILGVN